MNIRKLTCNKAFKHLVIASSAVMVTLTMTSTASANIGGYVTDGSNHGVTDGSGDCVTASLGSKVSGCGELPIAAPIKADPVPVAVVPPKPVYVAPPKPKPVYVPPPKPIVKVLRLNEAGGSNFAFDSDKLSDKARGELTSFAQTVKSSNVTPNNVTVVGHTDSIGAKAYNQKLSERRANSVANFLAAQGIDRGVMKVSGQGEMNPVASNKTKSGRAENRRVDISVSGQRKVTIRR
ncbi:MULTISPECIES: OmpA family protein [unclassified Cocleimonas]|uniref:OmpA family protein n=2 Tax=Cocleimonas TaxID=998014 RepID=UPI002DBEC93B|nr:MULTISPECIES: OmpA family protein [unclassified Cocleimonas]